MNVPAKNPRPVAVLRLAVCHDPAVLGDRGLWSKRPDVVVFPEIVDGGYAFLNSGAPPHRRDDPFLLSFRLFSRDRSLCCIAGSVLWEDRRSTRTNTSFVYDRGVLVHRYDKMHLFGPTGDGRHFVRGEKGGTFLFRHAAGRIRAGVVICYDLRFPELVRSMALEGMKILFVPARWPRVRDEAWRTLLKARAIENQIFVVGCNALGREGGYSYVFDPLGRMLLTSRGRTHVRYHLVQLNLNRIDAARALHRNLKDAVVLRKLLGSAKALRVPR